MNLRLRIIIVLFLPLVFTACSDDDTKTVSVPLTVSVPFNIDEASFMNQIDIDDCFNNLGELKASAYIYENTADLAFGGTGKIDDIDGNSPDPIMLIEISELKNAKYYYEVIIQEPKSYRTAVTCQADLDDPNTDDKIRFVTSGKYFRVGDIPDYLSDTPFPDVHPRTTTDCLECHTTTENYDVVTINHSFLQLPNKCIECHSSSTF